MYIKLLSIIAIVSICADASGTGTTVVHQRDVESTTRRSARDDIQSSTVIGITKRDIENGTTRVAREESLNVTKRNVPHVHRQFLSTTAKPNRVKSSIGETTSQSVHTRGVETTTRASRELNVTKREDVFNHTVHARADETTSHIIHARGVETTTRVSRDVNVTKREDVFNHTVHARADETTSHIIHAREVETTRSHRDLNVTRRAAGDKDEKKPNKVKLAIEDTTRSARDITTTHNIHARAVDTTRSHRDLNVTKREDMFNHTVIARTVDTTRSHRDLNATKRAAGHEDKPNKVKLAIEDTTRSSRDVSTSHIIHAREVVTTTRVSRDVNTTRKAAHKKEKATTGKPNKVVKLSVDDVVTNFTNAKVRSINEDGIITTTRAAVVRELFGGDLNVTKRAIETTVAGKIVRRGVVEPERNQMLLLISDDNSNGGGDDDTDNGDDNGDE